MIFVTRKIFFRRVCTNRHTGKKLRGKFVNDGDAIASRQHASHHRPMLGSSDSVIAEVRSLHRRAARTSAATFARPATGRVRRHPRAACNRRRFSICGADAPEIFPLSPRVSSSVSAQAPNARPVPAERIQCNQSTGATRGARRPATTSRAGDDIAHRGAAAPRIRKGAA